VGMPAVCCPHPHGLNTQQQQQRGKYACPFHDFTSAKAAEMEDHIRKVHDAQEVQSTDNSDGINYEVERLVDRRINVRKQA